MSPANPNPPTNLVTGERAAMLARMRAALVTPTSTLLHSTSSTAERATIASVLPTVPAAWEQRAALFGLRSERLHTTFHIVDDLDEMKRVVASLVRAEAKKLNRSIDEDDEAAAPTAAVNIGIAYHDHPIVSAVVESLAAGPRVRLAAGYDRAAFERCPIGITACEALIAQTGSVLVSSTQSGGRTASVLPPHHVVLATAADLIADLPAAYARVRDRVTVGGASMTSIITGPSRTGDIERILVLGAHGPKEVTVILTRST